MTDKKHRPNVGSEVIFELMYFDSNTYFISKKSFVAIGKNSSTEGDFIFC